MHYYVVPRPYPPPQFARAGKASLSTSTIFNCLAQHIYSDLIPFLTSIALHLQVYIVEQQKFSHEASVIASYWVYNMSYSGALMAFGRDRVACRRVGLETKRLYKAVSLNRRGLLTESYARGPSGVSSLCNS